MVFASIVNEGYVNMGSERLHCVFNKNADACNYGVFVGLVGLLACSFFGLLDYKFASISSIKDRKKAVMFEIGFSGEENFYSQVLASFFLAPPTVKGSTEYLHFGLLIV